MVASRVYADDAPDNAPGKVTYQPLGILCSNAFSWTTTAVCLFRGL